MKAVVIGGGINGMFTSYYLRKEGFDVTILEKEDRGRTSIYNAGLLTPSLAPARITLSRLLSTFFTKKGALYFSPSIILRNSRWFSIAMKKGLTGYEEQLIELGKQSLALYKEFLQGESIQADVINGVAAIYVDESLARRIGAEFNRPFITGQELEVSGYTGFGGGVLFEDEISIHSGKLFNSLRNILSDMQVGFVHAEALGFDREEDHVKGIISSKGNISGDLFVIASGAWTSNLCRKLGYDPLILPARGLVNIFYTSGKKSVSLPALLEDYGIGIAQHDADTLRITSFFEMTGFNDSFSKARRRWLQDVIKKHLRYVDHLQLKEEGVGYRPCTPDQMPVVGKLPRLKNVYINSGQCRLGMTLAPICANLLVSMIKENKQGPKRVDPSRFITQSSHP
ncbi:MAG: FAD-binding oxidoreductase [Conexivisphaerales archaeon]